MVKWRERGGEIAKAVQFPVRNKEASAVSVNILSHNVAAVLYVSLLVWTLVYCRSVVVDTCTVAL